MLHLLFYGIFDQINAALVSMWNWPQIYHMVIFGHCRLIVKTTFLIKMYNTILALLKIFPFLSPMVLSFAV